MMIEDSANAKFLRSNSNDNSSCYHDNMYHREIYESYDVVALKPRET